MAGPFPAGDWARARRAYLALVGEADPAAAVIAELAPLDLRPGGPAPVGVDPSRAVLVSGPHDLIELRVIVETAMGVGTWPVADLAVGPRHTGRIVVDAPAAIVGLLIAMEGLIDDRSPWRNWRTAVETLAPAVADLDELTLDALIVEGTALTMRAGPSRLG